jgi:hypothetical protein
VRRENVLHSKVGEKYFVKMRAKGQEAPMRKHDRTIAAGDAKHIAFKSKEIMPRA